MATFPFELVAPERILFSGEVDAVMLPGSEGDMTVLPGHAPVMTTLRTGFLVITERQHSGRRVLVRGGFAEINGRGLIVLAERALPVEELTEEALDHEILQAQMMYDASDQPEARQAAEAAIVQLQEAKATLHF